MGYRETERDMQQWALVPDGQACIWHILSLHSVSKFTDFPRVRLSQLVHGIQIPGRGGGGSEEASPVLH